MMLSALTPLWTYICSVDVLVVNAVAIFEMILFINYVQVF